MKAKAFLEQVYKIDFMIHNKMIEKDMWLDMAMNITSQLGGDRVQASGSHQKMANAVNNAIDVEREAIKLSVEALVTTKAKVISVIEKLPTNQYDILHLRYIQKKSFKEIADEKDISYSLATTIHGIGLKAVQKILNEMEKSQDGKV